MKTRIATAALAALLSSGISTAAFAAPAIPAPVGVSTAFDVQAVHYRGRESRRYGRQRVLPLPRIVRSLRHRGYTRIRSIERVRGDYIVVARGHRGPVRLVVDGRTAEIVSRQPLRRYGRDTGYRFGGHKGGFSYSFGIY